MPLRRSHVDVPKHALSCQPVKTPQAWARVFAELIDQPKGRFSKLTKSNLPNSRLHDVFLPPVAMIKKSHRSPTTGSIDGFQLFVFRLSFEPVMNLYSPHSDPKYQTSDPPSASSAPQDAIVSEDVHREYRIPPGQHRTRKWPVLHATSVPSIDPQRWKLSIFGMVDQPLTFDLTRFQALPRVKVFGDFHCVTTWSRLGNLWEGVSMRHLLGLAGVKPGATFAVVGGYDNGWTTNLPLVHLADTDVLLADTHDGLPIDADHGGPVRLVVPKLFAWKSAKWVKSIELTADNQPGYWEQAGYHNVGDPWKEQRYRDDPEWNQRNGD